MPQRRRSAVPPLHPAAGVLSKGEFRCTPATPRGSARRGARWTSCDAARSPVRVVARCISARSRFRFRSGAFLTRARTRTHTHTHSLSLSLSLCVSLSLCFCLSLSVSVGLSLSASLSAVAVLLLVSSEQAQRAARCVHPALDTPRKMRGDSALRAPRDSRKIFCHARRQSDILPLKVGTLNM